MKKGSILALLIAVLASAGCDRLVKQGASSSQEGQGVVTQVVPQAPSPDELLPPSDTVAHEISQDLRSVAEVEVYDIAKGQTVLSKRYRCNVWWNWNEDGAVAVSSDLTKIAFSNHRSGVYVLDVNGKSLCILVDRNTYSADYSIVNFSKDGKELIISGPFVGGAPYRGLRINDARLREVRDVEAYPNIKRVAEIDDNSKCVVRDLRTGQRLVTSTTFYGGSDNNDVKKYDLSDDGSTMAALYDYSTEPGPHWIQIWDVDKRQLKLSFSPGSGGKLELGWNGRYVGFQTYISSNDGMEEACDIWDTQDGHRVGMVTYGPPDSPLTIVQEGGKVKQVSNLGIWYTCQPSRNRATPDGKFFYVAIDELDGTEYPKSSPELWDLKTGTCLKKWDFPVEANDSFAWTFTPDNKKAVSVRFRSMAH